MYCLVCSVGYEISACYSMKACFEALNCQNIDDLSYFWEKSTVVSQKFAKTINTGVWESLRNLFCLHPYVIVENMIITGYVMGLRQVRHVVVTVNHSCRTLRSWFYHSHILFLFKSQLLEPARHNRSHDAKAVTWFMDSHLEGGVWLTVHWSM